VRTLVLARLNRKTPRPGLPTLLEENDRMSAAGHMLMNMTIDEAKRLRGRYGDAKYGTHYRDNVSFLAEAYIELIDVLNYLDIAVAHDEIDESTRIELANLTHALLAPLRRVTPRST
jgi:hypothetical protein